MSRNGSSVWRRSVLAWLSACVVLAASLATSAAPALAAFPGHDGRLAAAINDGDGIRRIALISPENGERAWLTPYARDAGNPAWSPDGSRLLFDYVEYDDEGAAAGVATMLADGTSRQEVRLGLDPRNSDILDEKPSFAPDGQHLIYTRWTSGVGYGIWTATLDGALRQRLRSGEAARWSPDASWIAYTKSTKTRSSASEMQYLWIMSATSHRRVRRISRQAEAFDWAPDGKRLVYANYGSGDLFITRVDGRRVRRLTSTPRSVESTPVWSPSGRSIAFARMMRSRWSVWTMSLRRGTLKRLWTGRRLDDEEDDLTAPQLAWQAIPRAAR